MITKEYFKLTFKKIDKHHNIQIKQYYHNKIISQVEIKGANNNFDSNHEAMSKITALLNELMNTNQNYQEELTSLQFIIDKAIEKERTQIGQNVLKQVKSNYNEYMLGHKELME